MEFAPLCIIFLLARLPSPQAFSRLSRQASSKRSGIQREGGGGGGASQTNGDMHVARVLVILQ